jgi:dolichyl-phosphate beta-glucosyltransferase
MINKNEIALVIPCYNEASRGEGDSSFENRLEQISKELNGSVVTNIILVNDGSKDNTACIIRNFIKSKNLENTWHFVDVQPNGGKGKALMEGLTFASKYAPYVAYIDADLSVPTRFLNISTKYCNSNTIICGRRAYKVKRTFPRKVASLLARLCNKWFIGIGIKDTQCPFKVMPSEAFLSIKHRLKGYRWIFDIELLWELEKEGFILKEMPVPFHNMESITLSTVKALCNCAKDVLHFKLKRLGR